MNPSQYYLSAQRLLDLQRKLSSGHKLSGPGEILVEITTEDLAILSYALGSYSAPALIRDFGIPAKLPRSPGLGARLPKKTKKKASRRR